MSPTSSSLAFFGRSKVMCLVTLFLLLAAFAALTSGQARTGTSESDDTNNARVNRRRGGRNRGRGRGNRRGGRDRLARFGCEPIYLPMCKGLVPYTHTKLPNGFGHTTQAEVFRALEPLSPYIDHHCSMNTRILACSAYLPKCQGRRPPAGPCRRTCMTAKRKCARTLRDELGLEWRTKFTCQGLGNRRCVRPVRETRCQQEYPNCINNTALPVCENLSFQWGALPNMFQQCRTTIINTEVSFFDSLLATNCHAGLRFLLCGVFAPYCVREERQLFVFPCRELCEEVREACEDHYKRLNHNLPWPSKLQCHRYPPSDHEDVDCVMPGEGPIFEHGRK